MTAQRTHVVVIGGGYAGTLAANHLRLRTDVDITLVNPRPKFVERIRLHQFVARSGDVTVDYGTLLGEGVRLVVDSADRIDTTSRQVVLASGRVLDYDYVVYAVGSTAVAPSAVPGASEFAYPIGEFEYAQRLRDALDELHPDAPVTVVGAGLTGTETAAELAEQGRKVTLVCGGTLVPSLSEPGRRSVAKWLRKMGVADRLPGSDSVGTSFPPHTNVTLWPCSASSAAVSVPVSPAPTTLIGASGCSSSIALRSRCASSTCRVAVSIRTALSTTSRTPSPSSVP